MFMPWPNVAVCALLLFAGAGSSARAEQVGVIADASDVLCGKEQLSGQYECVRSVPLSEEEVRVSMAYLASLRSLPVPEDRLARIASVRVSPGYVRLVRSESYHTETCGGDYVCGEDGAWARPWQ